LYTLLFGLFASGGRSFVSLDLGDVIGIVDVPRLLTKKMSVTLSAMQQIGIR